jgi:polysaccharide biosynthesis/export protein
MMTMSLRLSRKILMMLCMNCIAATLLLAQSSDKKDDPFSQKDQNQSQQSMQNFKVSVMDGPVDPKEYIVGPGDIYSVNIWISPPISLQLPVTPEGSVIIPTVGEVPVSGLHLDEAKQKVAAEVKKKYISGNVSFTLLTPRIFAVRVTGYGFKETTVYVQATERAQDAISLAKSQTDELLKTMGQTNEVAKLSKDETEKLSAQGSLRKIKIRHRDGTESTADIERFIATHERKCNPLLRDGDIVIVPARNILRDFVGVYGGVNGEGAYEFVDGDSLMSMILIARGCSPLADSGHVIISRTDAEGNTLQTISADLKAIALGVSPDVPLQRGDRIVVREKMELRRDDNVSVEGEVLYPGRYPITKDSTKLSDIIKAAGGFTDFASLSLSKVFRRSITEKEIVSERLESARGGVTPEDSAYFDLETNVRLNRELVVVDFASLFLRNDESKDVYVRDGDQIVIASKQKTIYVFGQVVRPGHVVYVSGKSYDFYVSLAGGFTEYARSGDTRIIKANTKQWLKPDETTIEEGDYVWVPKEPYRPFAYYMQLYGELFSIVGTLVTVVVLVVQLKK